MKTKEELNALKEEVETVSRKLAELTEEEITQVCGGVVCNGPCSECPVKDCPMRLPPLQMVHIPVDRPII